MSSQKPVFSFMAMKGCGHCVHFYQSPTPENSAWANLIRDPELQKAVQFRMVEWGAGKDPETGKLMRYELPQNLKFVNYGPYFYLHAASDSSTEPLRGKEFKAGEGGYQRNPSDMKRWILDTLKANPTLFQPAAVVKPLATAVPAPVTFARSTPVSQPPQRRAAPQEVMAPQPAYFPPAKEVQAVAPKPDGPRFIPRNRKR